jgi:hypothetical protein
MRARLQLSWGMKTLKLFLLPMLDSLEFAWQVIRYALIFVSAFFRQRASLGCEMVAIRPVRSCACQERMSKTRDRAMLAT